MKLDGVIFVKYILHRRRNKMRTLTQMQALEKLPDNDMGKKIIIKILNTPKPDYEKMKAKSFDYESELIAEMSEADRKKLAEINS